MLPDRIAELLVPFLGSHGLSKDKLAKINVYSELLQKWNAHINLTAVRDHEEIITRHFGESLFAARHLLSPTEVAKGDVESAIDVGSGAGFPGLPLKIWQPELNVILIESHGKKAVFLREVARALAFSNVSVFADRAENLKDRSGLVLLRAVERFEKVVPVAANLVSPSGRLALLIGNAEVEIAKSTIPQATWDQPLQLPLSNARNLLVGHFPG